MIATLSSHTKVLVQGMTGRMGRTHTGHMRRYGTNIVGGTAVRADAPAEQDGVPVFRDIAAAVAATGAEASIAMTPPGETRAAAEAAFAAGIKLLVTIAEGVPVHDALAIGRAARAAGAEWVGASTPGLAVPWQMKMGFLPNVALAPGDVALMSKSGTLSYETGYRMVQRGLGQSLWIGVGGDPVKGVRFADLLPVFQADARTRAIVLVGEVGGAEEEEFAEALAATPHAKPVFAIIAGREAKEGVSMGHAGALTWGEFGTHASKTKRLTAAGARCFDTVEALVEGLATR